MELMRGLNDRQVPDRDLIRQIEPLVGWLRAAKR